MPRLINAYTIQPSEIAAGDVMLFFVKAMVSRRLPACLPRQAQAGDNEGGLCYRIYRCRWDGRLEDVPQGDRVPDMEAACKALFPTLAQVAEPNY